MNQNSLSFSISPSIFKQTLKSSWVISLVGFILLFMSVGPSIYFASTQKYIFDKTEGYLGIGLGSITIFYYMILALLPITVSVIMFRYIHSKGRSVATHSMPFNRPQLFWSKYLAGLCVVIAPVIVNCLAVLPAVIKMTSRYESLLAKGFFENPETAANGLITVSSIMNMMIMSILAVFFIYAVSAFAAVISGNGLMQCVTAVLLNILVPTIGCLSVFFCKIFLFGYSFSAANSFLYMGSLTTLLYDMPITGFIKKLHPLLYLSYNDGKLNITILLVFGVLAIALSIAALMLYQRAKLERAGSPGMYRFTSYLDTSIITLIVSSLASIIIYTLVGQKSILLISLAIIGLATYIICQMIFNLKLKIFNKGFVSGISVFAVLMFVFVAIIAFDVTGYENKVPEISKIESIELSASDFNTIGPRGYSAKKIVIDSKENLARITRFHDELVKNKDTLKAKSDKYNQWNNGWINYDDAEMQSEEYGSFKLRYNIDGKKMVREYEIPKSFFRENQDLALLLKSDEYMDQMEYTDKYMNSITEMVCMSYSEDGNMSEIFSTDKDESLKLMKLIMEDYRDQSFEELLAPREETLTVEFEAEYSMKRGDDIQEGNSYITVPLTYKKTVNWLKEKGYYDKVYKGAVDQLKEMTEAYDDVAEYDEI